jgi:hypothetical protein
MKTTTIRVSAQTHQRITKQAKWGEPLEDVIIELLNYEHLTQEKIRKFHSFLLLDPNITLPKILAKFQEMFPE